MDENLDMVKMLNTLGARAAAFTIRDQQLADLEQRAHVGGVGFECPAAPEQLGEGGVLKLTSCVLRVRNTTSAWT